MNLHFFKSTPNLLKTLHFTGNTPISCPDKLHLPYLWGILEHIGLYISEFTPIRGASTSVDRGL